jgi:hypothetical protein
MSTTIQDYRKPDLRIDIGGDPFWITSRVVDGHEVSGLKDKACVLFSFPTVGQQVIIREIAVRVLVAFTAATTLELGTYILAKDADSTDAVATEEISDAFVAAADITATTAGWYFPKEGDFVEARASGMLVEGGNLIVGAAVNGIAIALSPKVATILIGKVQVSMLICVVPGS